MPSHDPIKLKTETRGGAGRGQGRKPIGGTGAKRVNVSIDDATRARAVEIGNGNLSAGIRIAVENFQVERK